MKELISETREIYATPSMNVAFQTERGSKATDTHARKTLLKLEKLMKEFRKISLEESEK